MISLPFNRPWFSGEEAACIAEVFLSGHISGNGPRTRLCHELLRQYTGCQDVFLTQSCSAALEMAALVSNIQYGDEVIMPSYTFVSTANAFLMRGATPVFVDIRADTLNIDEAKIEAAISPRTKAIVPVHYAGVPCEMDYILRISQSYGFWVISDAAQALGSFYKGRDVLSIGHMSTVSFHETKNISSGEGGALIVNDARFLERASIAWEKGTNRKAFFEGLVDKYTWIDLGSSYLPSEVTAALLLIQLKNKDFILSERMRIWESYHSLFRDMEEKGLVRRPFIPEGCTHNAHMYYLLLRQEGVNRSEVLNRLKDDGIHAVFHYTPLHTSPAGIKYGRVSGDMINTDKLSSLLIRLPLWIGLSNSDAVYVRERVEHAILASML